MSSQLASNLHFEISFPGPDGQIQRRTFVNPVRLLVANKLDEVAGVIDAVSNAAHSGLTAVGFVAYEAASAFDAKLVTHTPADFPLALFGVFDKGTTLPDDDVVEPDNTRWQLDTPFALYEEKIDAIRQAIHRGDTYQVNYTLRSLATVSGDGLGLYRQLAKAQNARYSAYLRFEGWEMVSVSPELFFRWDGTRIETRPVKGTAARNPNVADDDAGCRLIESVKDQAENVMIVDLLRNDLGRITKYGSVTVDELFSLETYPTFYQLASQISATTLPNTTLLDVFKALFPCGSVTGAPKRSTMAYIAELESSPRGVYCGAIGIVEPMGGPILQDADAIRAVFSVPIRTTTIDSTTRQAVTGLGSGVTWDSNARNEYEEVTVKARYLNSGQRDWSLLETLRLEDGTYWLLEEHLDRLGLSAKAFDISWSELDVRGGLAALAEAHEHGSWRIRLLVGRDGQFRTEIFELNDLPELLKVGLSTNPISSSDIWLQNKTTNRDVYEERLKEFEKAFDVLLINERGELTEFTRGNLVLQLANVYVTPPLSSGLLNGTLRSDLLKSGSIVEHPLYPEDLHKAKDIWFINSVRGWVQVNLIK